MDNPTFQKRSKISVIKETHCLNYDGKIIRSIKELLIRPIKKTYNKTLKSKKLIKDIKY